MTSFVSRDVKFYDHIFSLNGFATSSYTNPFFFLLTQDLLIFRPMIVMSLIALESLQESETPQSLVAQSKIHTIQLLMLIKILTIHKYP